MLYAYKIKAAKVR